MAELVLVRGLPGSGKTTIARGLAADGYRHYEADQYFERDGSYQFQPALLSSAHAWCMSSALDALKQGHRVVVANTFTRRWEMEPYLAKARQLGATVRIIEATGSWPNVHGVTDEGIARMRARWEAIDVTHEVHL